MFVQHKQLKELTVSSSRVGRLYRSGGSNVQMAFPGYPAQMCGAYLICLTSGDKVLVLIGFYLTKSCEAIFYIPQKGEVSIEEAEKTFSEGLLFAESMGFVLSETDYHLLSPEDQQKFWNELPITQSVEQRKAALSSSRRESLQERVGADPLEEYRSRSLQSLGRFLASM